MAHELLSCVVLCFFAEFLFSDILKELLELISSVQLPPKAIFLHSDKLITKQISYEIKIRPEFAICFSMQLDKLSLHS